MTVSISITQSNVQEALRTFLLSIMSSDIEVVEGQDNRVAEPECDNFIVFWPIRSVRIETNTDTNVDVKFLGSTAGNSLIITVVDFGTIKIGNTLFGNGVADNTNIVAQVSGSPGGVGIYTTSGDPQTLSERVLAAGANELYSPHEVVMQLDVHGENSANNARIISATFRDQTATERFKSYGFDVHPLYIDDPRQVPFIGEDQQYDNRWIIELHLQMNPIISIPQQSADAAVTGLIDVDVVYPP